MEDWISIATLVKHLLKAFAISGALVIVTLSAIAVGIVWIELSKNIFYSFPCIIIFLKKSVKIK